MKTIEELNSAGFTESGALRYETTTTAYASELFTKSIALGDMDKAENTGREVTHDHVRSAAAFLSLRRQEATSKLSVWCQIGEYLCAAGAGVGGGKLDESWGIGLFGISLTLGIILFVVRNTKGRLS